MIKGIIIRPDKDNVAVVSADVKRGDQVSCATPDGAVDVTALDDVPIYHKICLCDLKKGDTVVKYGEGIGRVTEDVKKGAYIHTHNVGLLKEEGA